MIRGCDWLYFLQVHKAEVKCPYTYVLQLSGCSDTMWKLCLSSCSALVTMATSTCTTPRAGGECTVKRRPHHPKTATRLHPTEAPLGFRTQSLLSAAGSKSPFQETPHTHCPQVCHPAPITASSKPEVFSFWFKVSLLGYHYLLGKCHWRMWTLSHVSSRTTCGASD